MPEKTWRVLLADVDSDETARIQSQLEQHNIQAIVVNNQTDTVEALDMDFQLDAMILDLQLCDQDGGYDNGLLGDVVRKANEQLNIPLFLLVERGKQQSLPSRLYDSVTILSRPFDTTQFLIAASNTSLRPMVQEPINRVNWSASTSISDTIPFDRNKARTIVSREALTRRTSDSGSAEMGWELRNYWHVLLRYKWVLLVVTMAAILVSIGISKLLTPIYSAKSTIRVASAAGGQFDYGASTLATRLTNTYVEIATSTPILDELARRLGIAEAPDIEVEPIPETELLEITAKHSDPQIAKEAANYLAEIMVERSLVLYAGDAPTARELLEEQVQQAKEDLDEAEAEYTQLLTTLSESESEGDANLNASSLDILARKVTLRQDLYTDLLMQYEEARSAEELRGNAITIVEYAYQPRNPSSPKIALNAILGGAGGILGGLLLIIVLESFSNTVSSTSEIKSLTGLQVLAQIPSVRRGRRQLVPNLNRNTTLADAFQALQVRLQFSDLLTRVPRPIILVTSPEPNTGKSTIATNLAISFARSGHEVILVDADLHRPSVHRIFNFDNKVGLADVLIGKEMPDDVLHKTANPKLRVLTSGMTSPETSLTGVISPYKIKLVLNTLAEKCDYVIVDAPGLLATGYSIALAKEASAIVFVTAQHHTDRDTLETSLQQLWDINANVAGVVINKASFHHSYAYAQKYPRR